MQCNLDEVLLLAAEKEEVVAVLAEALGSLDIDGPCRLHTCLRGVRTAVIHLAKADTLCVCYSWRQYLRPLSVCRALIFLSFLVLI